MRMNCSKLNAHLCYLHVIEAPDCNCGFDYENTNHYLLSCPLYTLERNILFTCLENLGCNNIMCELVLYGNANFQYDKNIQIVSHIFSFIEKNDWL